jgi:hypothetical protein
MAPGGSSVQRYIRRRVSGVALTAASDADRFQMVVERMEAYLARYEAARDARAVFTFGYLQFTRALRAAIGVAPFADPAWVVLVVERFAEKYFEALDALDQGRAPVTPWREVFEAILNQRSSVLEDLVFGITAHIVHDLPLTLVEVGMVDMNGASRVADHHLINEVLKASIDGMQDAVARRYEPLVWWLDHLGSDLDEIATDYGLRVSRGLAWYNAIRLLDERSREDALAAIKRGPLVLIEEVRRPPVWSLRFVLRGMRWVSSFFRRWPEPAGG